MANIIEADGLVKRYGATTALDGLTLAAPSGQLTALLGPNGAGKTTFISAVATLLRPDSGTLRVAGIDAVGQPQEVRRLIGLAGQYASVEPAMSGRENLVLVGRLFGLERADAKRAAGEVLELLNLTEAGDRLVRTYSGGMRRRLDLGASLVGRPRLLLLDEPTTGLDPGSRLDLWEAIRNLVTGVTDVLLTTQYLEEADQLARQVVIVDHGKVIAAGSPSELKTRAGSDVLQIRADRQDDTDTIVSVAREVGGTEPNVDAISRTVTVPVDGAHQLMDALRRLDAAGVHIDDIALRRPTLDEVFLTLTGAAAGAGE